MTQGHGLQLAQGHRLHMILAIMPWKATSPMTERERFVMLAQTGRFTITNLCADCYGFAMSPVDSELATLVEVSSLCSSVRHQPKKRTQIPAALPVRRPVGIEGSQPPPEGLPDQHHGSGGEADLEGAPQAPDMGSKEDP